MEPHNTNKESTVLAIGTFSTDIYSETFIRQHIDLLPFTKTLLLGHELSQTSDGRDLLHRTIYVRALQKALMRLGRFQFEQFREKRIANFLTQANVSVVLAEYGTSAAKLLKPCAAAKVPLIAHFHGFDAYVDNVLQKHDAYRELFLGAAAIVAVSRDMKEQLEKLGGPPQRIHYIPYFVDPNRFVKAKASANPPVFLSVGRFVEKKAPLLTLVAFSKVLDQLPSATLRFIGDGALLGPTMQLAASLGVSSSVEFLGALPHDEVAQKMRQARCFVQHSVRALNGDSEGTPVSILEAQASGLPVVATHHTGIKDVVVEGQTGFLVDECDVNGMAEYMLRLANDPALADSMGRRGAQRIREIFNRQNTLDKLSQVITSVSKAHKSANPGNGK